MLYINCAAKYLVYKIKVNPRSNLLSHKLGGIIFYQAMDPQAKILTEKYIF